MKKARNYKKEYRENHSSTAQKKDRAARNHARREAMKRGTVHKGDGKEIDHKDNNPRNNSSANTRAVSKATNLARPRRKLG